MQLDHAENVARRNVIPFLYLQLGSDLNCDKFVKW